MILILCKWYLKYILNPSNEALPVAHTCFIGFYGAFPLFSYVPYALLWCGAYWATMENSVPVRIAVSRSIITTAYQITAQWQHHPSHWIIQPSAIWHRKQGMVIQCYWINVTCFENKHFSFVIFNRPRRVWMFLSVLSDILLGDAFSILLGILLKCTLRSQF